MKNPWIKIETFKISGFDLRAPEGYKIPKSPKNGKPLPHCCKFHQQAFEGIQEWFMEFPNCCQAHRELIKNPLFSKADYQNIPTKIINQISYTEYIIGNKTSHWDWFENITDYIFANFESFGSPAVGWDRYVSILKHQLNNTKWLQTNLIPIEKANILLEYLDKEFQPQLISNDDTFDLDVLYETYNKWLEIFPFEISYFQHLKEPFEKRIPIFKGQPQVNRYSGLACVKSHSKLSLIQLLLDTTNELVTKINALKLYEDGKITDVQKTELEILNSRRRQDLKLGYTKEPNDLEKQFHQIIKKWLEDEQTYLYELKRIVSPLMVNKNYNINNIDNAKFS